MSFEHEQSQSSVDHTNVTSRTILKLAGMKSPLHVAGRLNGKMDCQQLNEDEIQKVQIGYTKNHVYVDVQSNREVGAVVEVIDTALMNAGVPAEIAAARFCIGFEESDTEKAWAAMETDSVTDVTQVAQDALESHRMMLLEREFDSLLYQV